MLGTLQVLCSDLLNTTKLNSARCESQERSENRDEVRIERGRHVMSAERRSWGYCEVSNLVIWVKVS